MENTDPQTALKLYELIISRYRDLINEKEKRSISEIRQRVNPYDEYVKSLRDKLIQELQPYSYEKHFFSAVQKLVDYIKSIKNVKMPVTFWMSFQEIDDLKAGDVMDQALLLASLLRSLDSKDVKVYVTVSEKIFVGFSWNNEKYTIDPESGSMYRGDDSDALFSTDRLAYAFSDIYFESFEEE